jgi:xanthine/CO dehydrogenase XdhC/CoxF family maturation factor
LKDIYDILREWKIRRGERFVLATLVRAQGSSYRRASARMLICEDSTTVGSSLSAGCAENEVAYNARKVLGTGEPLELRYVGLIGPRKRRDQIVGELLEIGVTINAGFFAPAGLSIGSETPEKIALGVVSEIQRVFDSATGESLRERKTAIHQSNTTAPPPSEWQKLAQ